MTPKQRVLKKWPKGWVWYAAEHGAFFVFKGCAASIKSSIGNGYLPRAAWADAARRLKERNRG